MHRRIAPYSYGLAARARRIYNDVACSGGQGGRSSRRALPLEATRPGLLGTPGLVYSSSQRPGRLRHATRFIGSIAIGKTQTRHAVIGPARAKVIREICSMTRSATMISRTIPRIALSASRT